MTQGLPRVDKRVDKKLIKRFFKASSGPSNDPEKDSPTPLPQGLTDIVSVSCRWHCFCGPLKVGRKKKGGGRGRCASRSFFFA